MWQVSMAMAMSINEEPGHTANIWHTVWAAMLKLPDVVETLLQWVELSLYVCKFFTDSQWREQVLTYVGRHRPGPQQQDNEQHDQLPV